MMEKLSPDILIEAYGLLLNEVSNSGTQEELEAVKTSATKQAEAVVAVSCVQADFCKRVEREIKRYGVEMAMSRWRVVCDYLQTEPWWPTVANRVEALFDDAYDRRNRLQMEAANRQPAPLVQLNNNPAATSPAGIDKADQVIVSNRGEVAYTKY